MINTEQDSHYAHLDQMTVGELIRGINSEDHTVPDAVEEALPQIESAIQKIIDRMHKGGRVFYMGAGTSGRIGVVDASEIPPTYGVRDKFIGLIAGGNEAMFQAVEGAEDDFNRGWEDLQPYNPNPNDTIVGLAASGRTPYVIGAIQKAKEEGLLTVCITCNQESELSKYAECPIEVITGPEFVTGSTRMKAASAEKMVLNMISTVSMIALGHVQGNKMMDMQLTNAKLIDRGTRMILEKTQITDYEQAKALLLKYGSVRKAVESLK